MATKKVMYKCDKCQKTYSTEKAADNCLVRHNPTTRDIAVLIHRKIHFCDPFNPCAFQVGYDRKEDPRMNERWLKMARRIQRSAKSLGVPVMKYLREYLSDNVASGEWGAGTHGMSDG